MRRTFTLPLALLFLLQIACGSRTTLPTLTPADGTLYQDDFTTESARWETFDDLQLSTRFDAGHLVLSVNTPDALTWSVLGVSEGTFDDFTLTVDANALAGPTNNSYGVLFRYQDRFNFYSFDISGDGWYRVRVRQGDANNAPQREIVPWTHSDAIHAGTQQTNTLTVTAQATQLTLLINNQALPPITDATFTHGQIGLSAGSYDETGVQIAFDNLVVKEP